MVEAEEGAEDFEAVEEDGFVAGFVGTGDGHCRGLGDGR